MATKKDTKKKPSTTERWASKAKKTETKAKPKDLGKGMAGKAAKAISKRRQMLDEI